MMSKTRQCFCHCQTIERTIRLLNDDMANYPTAKFCRLAVVVGLMKSKLSFYNCENRKIARSTVVIWRVADA